MRSLQFLLLLALTPYIGRDRSQWTASLPSLTTAPNPNGVVYAGGDYNISLAKTAVDAAGNIYAIGSQIVTIGSYTARSVFVTKIDPTGTPIHSARSSIPIIRASPRLK
jgi:hypothetical protein